MDASTLLMRALAAGAVATFRPNQMYKLQSQKVIVAATMELKRMIQQRYGQVNVDLLDIGPGSAERQQALVQQLRDAGVTEDKEILRQAQVVLDAISEEDAKALWASEVADPAPQHT